MQNETAKNPLIEEFVDPEIQKAIGILFSGETTSETPEASFAIAGLFGVSSALKSVFADGDTAEQEQKLIKSFHRNLNLLVQKTWVEKSDITFKEQVLYRLDTVCDNLASDSYHTCYEEIVSLLKDAVYLMFGNEAKANDFLDFAFAIDPLFGIFCWYMTCLPAEAPATSYDAKLKLLPGIVFLSNF